MRIVIAKEAFNKQIPLLTSKLNIELGKKLVRCYVWSIALYDSLTWTLKQLELLYVVLEEKRYLRNFYTQKWGESDQEEDPVPDGQTKLRV